MDGSCRRLVDGVIEGPGHPALSPDGRSILVNCNAGGDHMEQLILTDLF